MVDKNNKIPLVHCFLDTNILLEFEAFSDVDWPKVLNAKQVCLVLAPIVLRELDKHKTDYNNPRLQKRARMLLPKIMKLIEADELPRVRRNVRLMVLPNEPLIDWAKEHLDPSVNDDRLIASVLDFSSQRLSEKILLLSDDSGPRLKAKSHKIQSQAPPDGVKRLVEPPSPEAMKIRQLEQQLQELTDRIPKLRVGFYENGEVVDEIRRPMDTTWLWQTPEGHVQEELARKREALAQIVARADHTVDEDEVRKFTEEYEAYLAKLQPALKMQFINDLNPYCKLELTVTNEGTAPAHEISVNIAFPTGSSLITLDGLDSKVNIEAEMPKEPALPEWARPPVPAWAKNMLSQMQLSSFPGLMQSLQMIHSPLYMPKLYAPGAYRHTYYIDNFPFDSNVITEGAKRIGHHHRMLIKPMVVYLPPNARRGFTITYSLLFDEIPNPIKGALKVQWEPELPR